MFLTKAAMKIYYCQGGGVRMWNYIDKSQRFGGWTASVFRVEEYKKLHVTYWQAAFFEISLI